MTTQIHIVLLVGGEAVEELPECVHCVLGKDLIGNNLIEGTFREPNCSRQLEEEKVCVFIPGIGVAGKGGFPWFEDEGPILMEAGQKTRAARRACEPNEKRVAGGIVLRGEEYIMNIFVFDDIEGQISCISWAVPE
jgi:hypothetical protein